MSDMLEKMVINLLKNMGFDPQMLKNEVESRYKTFEDNITRLNFHLGTINSRLENIENHLGIAKVTASVAASNSLRSQEGLTNDTNSSEDNHPLAIEGTGIEEPKLSPEYEGPAA